MPARSRSLRWLVPAVLALAACLVTVHVQQVHLRSGEYGWSPSATAPRIQFSGRDYVRSRNRVVAVPTDESPLGLTEGGGRIHGKLLGQTAPTVLHVVAGGDVVEYALVGGP